MKLELSIDEVLTLQLGMIVLEKHMRELKCETGVAGAKELFQKLAEMQKQ